jgi:hypothetical protein
VWAQTFSGSGSVGGSTVTTDASGNVYVGGAFSGTVTLGAITLTTSSQPNYSGLLVKYDAQGTVRWAHSVGGSGTAVTAVGTDAQGFVYVTGTFAGTATFGTQSLTSAGNADIFVAKYDALGTPLWARRGGGAAADVVNDLAVQPNGTVFVTGALRGPATFGGFALTCQGISDAFVVRYNADGTEGWAQRGGGPLATTLSNGIAVDATGYVTITGSYAKPVQFGTVNLPNASAAQATNMFLVRYDNQGGLQWAQQFGHPVFAETATSIAADANGNLLVAGEAPSGITIGAFSMQTTGVFLVKFNVQGVLQWGVPSATANMYNHIAKVAVDPSGAAYVTGQLYSVLDLGPYRALASGSFYKMYLAKVSASGVVEWLSAEGGNANTDGLDLHADAAGNLHVVGTYAGSTANPTAVFGSFSFPGSATGRLLVGRLGSACTAAVPVITSNSPVCAGSPLTLTATNVPAGATYQWTGPNGFVSTRPTVQVTADSTRAGTFALTVSQQGCPGNAAPVTVVVRPAPPQPQITQSTSSGAVVLTSSSPVGNQWLLNGQPLAGATAPTLTPVVPGGTYSLVVTSPNGCVSPPANAAVVTSTRSGTATGLSVYPNPAPTGELTLSLQGYHSPVHLTVLNALGQLHYAAVIPVGQHTVSLPLQALPKGIYLVRVTAPAGTTSQRVSLK